MPSSRYTPPKDLSAYAWLSISAALATIALKAFAAWITGSVGLLSAAAESVVTLVADATHLATDVVTSAAVLLGVGLVAVFDSPVLDAIVALGAGLNIMWTGFKLISESVAGLMDVAPGREAQERIEAVLRRHRLDGRIDFHAVRVREAGNRRFAEMHVLVPGTWSVKEGHDFTERMIDELVEVDPNLRVSAHLEPIEDPKSYEDVEDV